MTKNLPAQTISAIEAALIQGDLKQLTPEQRLSYYKQVCDSVGLNPLTKPFEYITLNGKLTLYALRAATDQLRKLHKVSIKITDRQKIEDVYIVTSQATDSTGRFDESTGAVNVAGLKGEALANAFLKAETKAKRRVTLSLCGLGLLDETEVADIPTEAKEVNESKKSTFQAIKEKVLGAPEQKDDPGAFVFNKGKFKGVPLKELDPFELNNYLGWLKSETEKSGKEMKPDFVEFCEKAEAYLQTLEKPSTTEEIFDLEDN
jgi:hypothetical protein